MNLKEFLSFKQMVTPTIMKIFYIVTAGVMALGTIIGAFAAIFSSMTLAGGALGVAGGMFGFFSILIIGVIGQVVFRIFCEALMAFFSMRDELMRIRKKVVGDCEPAAPAPQPIPTPEANDNPPNE